MTADFEKLARTVLQLTEAVGIKEMSAKDALDRLESCIIAECCDLRGIRSIWKVICMSTEVLAILVPEKKEIFLLRGDGPEGPVDIPPEVLAKIMIS
ncbi:MAG: hypothetical protein K8T25_15330 [Planctomycetia bacterium]|nr:hypothetical protein [Planctomycetia bacterium]